MATLRLVKTGEPAPSSTGMTAASPIPTPSVEPTQAPGKRGPVGMGPRTNYSRVNTGLPPVSDAGATEQKSMAPRGAEMLPKLASGEEFMGNLASRPSLSSMVKTAVAATAERIRITAESELQAAKTAGESCKKCGKEKCACMGKMASAEAPSSDFVEKLASACDYAAELLRKEASTPVGNPPGVSEAMGGATLKDHHGQGVNIVPKHPGEQKGLSTEHGATQMDNTLAHGVPGEMPANIVSEKHAFSASPEGHKYDAKMHASERDAAGVRREARAEYAKTSPLKHVFLDTGLARKGVGPLSEVGDMYRERHGDYAAKKHEKGENAYNPLGGILTPTQREKKASDDSPLALIREKLAAADAEKKETEGMREAEKGLAKAEKAHESEPENKDEKKEGSAFASLADGLAAAIKQAEDAINPAQISAGKAVPPDTSAAGESGGEPVGGAPRGPTSLVGSNEAAQNYTKGQSHGPRREELGKYFAEPALSATHDSTLRDVFVHTGQAGTKFASAPAAASPVKTAAARVLLSKLAADINSGATSPKGA